MKLIRKWRWWIIGGLGLLAFSIVFLIVLADRYVEPALKQRLHTLIIEGSDSLYTYSLGDLRVSFFGGNVEIDELRVQVDSNRYRQLEARGALPSITLHMEMHHGHLHGLGVLPLIFGKRLSLHELKSENADVRLTRHNNKDTAAKGPKQPFWKAIQPQISRVSIDRVRFSGLKLLYKNADTALSMKLQFDTCHAELDDVRIDSIGAFDTSRMGFARQVYLELKDVKFRTADSASKMKAEAFRYSSKERTLEVREFKIQPTLKEKEAYYASPTRKEGMSVIEFKKGVFTNFRLEKYLSDNFFVADSLLIDKPEISSYTDKTFPPFMESKVGSYPHQKLQKANSYISIKGVAIRNATLSYTEKAEKTRQEGTIKFSELDIIVSNITNDPASIRRDPRAIATMRGKIFGSSPVNVRFTFHLDSTRGQFDAEGEIKNIDAARLNSIAVPLANTRLESFNMKQLNFRIHGDDDGGRGEVRMLYDQLYVVLQKTDPTTGETKVNSFFTRLMNQYVLYPSNPGADGVTRVATNVKKSRLSFQGFFGVVWKTVFAGMQDVMVRSGSFE